MTHLRKMMLEELQRRHYSEATTRRYIRLIERFAQHFHRSPDRLGPQHIREYQAQLFTLHKLTSGSVTNHLCALRFFYIQTLKRPWSIADTPYPKKRYRLPTILSQEEVAQLIEAAPTPFYRTILMTLYGAETLLEVARNPAHLGAEIGFFSVLHTWNQKLQLHPHVHCVVPAGGLSRDHARWIRSHPRFFLPIAVLRRVFRGKFVAGLKSAFERRQLHLAGELAPLTHPKFFAAWLRPLFRKDWIVYSKPPFGGPDYVLQYLGRYTHRVAISNHRLLALVDGQVTFRWRDSADHNRQKVMTLSRDEFLRRFLLHMLPKGFVRIRHFGFLANRRRAALLPRCFAALHATPPKKESETSTAPTAHPLWRCPKCGGPMAVVERFTAAQLQLRSPPLLATAA